METHFQTSFIPKKPIISSGQQVAPSSSQGTSLIMMIGVFVFIISILLAGGSYGWKAWLISQRQVYKNTLKARNDEFDLTQITKLKQTDLKIQLANQILNNHIATTLVLEKLSKLTSEGIRFTSFDMTAPSFNTQGQTGNKGLSISMSGYGKTYKVVAFQSDLFDHLEAAGVRGEILNGMVTNPSQNQNTTISFDMTAAVNPESVSYNRLILGQQSASSTGSGSSSNASSTTP